MSGCVWPKLRQARVLSEMFAAVCSGTYPASRVCLPGTSLGRRFRLLMESVASMDETDKAVMSQAAEEIPYRIDAAGISPCPPASAVLV